MGVAILKKCGGMLCFAGIVAHLLDFFRILYSYQTGVCQCLNITLHHFFANWKPWCNILIFHLLASEKISYSKSWRSVWLNSITSIYTAFLGIRPIVFNFSSFQMCFRIHCRLYFCWPGSLFHPQTKIPIPLQNSPYVYVFSYLKRVLEILWFN